MKAARELLRSLIDYAGLFPPAALGMDSAVRTYAAHRSGEQGWILGRFVLPASRLEEFARTAAAVLSKLDPWPLSVLAGKDLENEAQQIGEFRRRADVRIESIEVRTESCEQIQAASRVLGAGTSVFFEIPIADPPERLLEAVRQARGRAKIRMGGTERGMVPPVSAVARFLSLSGSAPRTAFKATAGLHHAIRSLRPLTYQPGCETDLMHGFLNLFVASTFSHSGQAALVPGVLEERDPRQFAFRGSSVSWRDHAASSDQVAAARGWAESFGSCSFEEPVAELRELGIL